MDYHQSSQIYPYILAGIGVLICIMYYFYEVLGSEKIVHVHRRLIFWICIGYFFYYLAIVPIKLSQNTIKTSEDFNLLQDLFKIMTVVLNVSLIIGFLWSQEEKKS
jgi:hypothetical protein